VQPKDILKDGQKQLSDRVHDVVSGLQQRQEHLESLGSDPQLEEDAGEPPMGLLEEEKLDADA